MLTMEGLVGSTCSSVGLGGELLTWFDALFICDGITFEDGC